MENKQNDKTKRDGAKRPAVPVAKRYKVIRGDGRPVWVCIPPREEDDNSC